MTSFLREGNTTGTCAAAAALAAAILLVRNTHPESVLLTLPNGRQITLPILLTESTAAGARAVVRKDAGDDPDITDQAQIVAEIAFQDPPPQADAAGRTDSAAGRNAESAAQDAHISEADKALLGIRFLAGDGVGTITRPGLQLPPGEPAINPVPRRQIALALRQVTDRPLTVRLSIPGGRELAARTFNPKLGIVGGLSIIGTSGIVRPFSHEARRESVLCALRVALASLPSHTARRPLPTATGQPDCTPTRVKTDMEEREAVGDRDPGASTPERILYLVPGHYGETAARTILAAPPERIVEVGNDWDCAFAMLAAQGAEAGLSAVWLVGHPGKLAKFPGGHFQTHSRISPPALAEVAALAAELGARTDYAGETVDGLFQTLCVPDRQRLGTALAERIALAAQRRMPVCCRVLLVDMKGDELGRSANAADCSV